MKTQISRDSHRPEKHYSGVYQQQGRMLTDADWNELVTLINERITCALRDVVGNGFPAERAPGYGPGQDELEPGVVYAQGLSVENVSPVRYLAQQDFPSAPGPMMDGDTVYVDMWERPVLALEDAGLKDAGLHGADTCTRTQVMFQLKRAPPGVDPMASPLNPPRGDADFTLHRRETEPGSEADAARTLGNFLFRLEVHDVKGSATAPTEITLKWSTENAAEAYANDDHVPQDFKGNDWVYEFYNGTSERHLGVHLVAAPGFPVRGLLEAGYPVTPPDAATWPYVRRWDGWCVLSRVGETWTLVEGRDRGAVLAVGSELARHGNVVLAGGSVSVALRDLNMYLSWNSRSVVAGDFWLTEVREDEAEKLVLASIVKPVGLVHRYMKLGQAQIAGGMFVEEPGLRFPSLTGLTSAREGRPGSFYIGSAAIEGSFRSLNAGTVQSQLGELLTHLDDSGRTTVHTVSFNVPAGVLDPHTVRRGDGVLVAGTENGPVFVTSLNSSNHLMGRHDRGSFIGFRGAFDRIEDSRHVAYVMSGSPIGDLSGGFGFRVTHDGAARRLHGVTFGANGALAQAVLLDPNLPAGVNMYRAVHRGPFIEFFVNGTSRGTAPATNMVVTTHELYSVYVDNSGTGTPLAEVAIAFLTIGNQLY